MAGSAELIQETRQAKIFGLENESYAHSLSTLRRLGSVALSGEKSIRIEQLAFDDFVTAVSEMLKTDAEFRDYLEIDNIRAHAVINGRVTAVDATPMVEILENGVISSKLAAQSNPELGAQVIRDKCDVGVAQRVDALPAGMSLWGISMEPTEELIKFEKTYKELGYKKGLAYLQTYSKTIEGTVLAGSFSLDIDNPEIIWEVLAKRSMKIPHNASTNEWLNYAQIANLNSEEMVQLVQDIRFEIYLQSGKTHNIQSATEFVASRQDTVQQYFATYYTELAKAITSGKNNDTMKAFAKALQDKNIERLKPEIKKQLLTIANSGKFSDDNGKLIDSLLRYALVEELRRSLKRDSNDTKQLVIAPESIEYGKYKTYTINPEMLAARLADNIDSGVTAGRSYGGCPGNIELSNSLTNGQDKESELNPLEAYGGKGKETLLKCVTCPICKKEGVDARIEYNDKAHEKTITCSKCKKSKTYKT